ncbi:MAG: 4-alpha-glucanotransferase [Gammaproteobacteria bacterium]|nr:4-alpha-glucanotransferase [Gammaproteobacteria bacterium]
MRNGDSTLDNLHKSKKQTLDRRRAGVLLHITSLPGRAATGDLGTEAFYFVDFLANAGFTVWQTLPVGPTQSDGSPYQTSSSHAGNPALISLEPLVSEGWLDEHWHSTDQYTQQDKNAALVEAWKRFRERPAEGLEEAYDTFVSDQNYWLDDYALFHALHKHHDDLCWWEWPAGVRDRNHKAIAQARQTLADAIDYARFEQFLFFNQWDALRTYANSKGVQLFGDMPIFVAHDSAEVWAHRNLFALDDEGHPKVVAGVPPDYFSETGQRWGNPLYCWDQMEAEDFAFWGDRLRTQLRLYDLIRIDHFRGFESYWEIPASEEYAINGEWVKASGEALFRYLQKTYNPLPLVAEDLGIITPEVEGLRDSFGLPGMKILQFAFSGESDNPYLPYHHQENSVVYTGTHDNDTTLGWYRSLDDKLRQYVNEYLGNPREIMPWPLIRMALASCSHLAILPMQDILGLDGDHRMNTPGTTEDNWSWRFNWEMVEGDLADRMRRRIKMYGRLVH